MSALANIFENNQRWAEGQEAKEPGFFAESAKGQAPKYLWIGCADSRVPANQVTGLEPGELFVHRNIANVVGSSDLSLLSVVQYAVEHLKVEHVLVCGHYGCGGVAASVDGQDHGLVDNWIKAVGAIAERHEDELKSLPEGEMLDRLCELNVQAQARNLSQTTILQGAWSKGQNVQIHPIIYQLSSGLLKGLGDPLTA